MRDNLVEWSQGQFPIYHIFKLQIKKMTSNLSSKTTYKDYFFITLGQSFYFGNFSIMWMLEYKKCYHRPDVSYLQDKKKEEKI